MCAQSAARAAAGDAVGVIVVDNPSRAREMLVKISRSIRTKLAHAYSTVQQAREKHKLLDASQQDENKRFLTIQFQQYTQLKNLWSGAKELSKEVEAKLVRCLSFIIQFCSIPSLNLWSGAKELVAEWVRCCISFSFIHTYSIRHFVSCISVSLNSAWVLPKELVHCFVHSTPRP